MNKKVNRIEQLKILIDGLNIKEFEGLLYPKEKRRKIENLRKAGFDFDNFKNEEVLISSFENINGKTINRGKLINFDGQDVVFFPVVIDRIIHESNEEE